MAGDRRKISSFSNKIKVAYKTTELEAYKQSLAKLQATELNTLVVKTKHKVMVHVD